MDQDRRARRDRKGRSPCRQLRPLACRKGRRDALMRWRKDEAEEVRAGASQ